MLDEAQDRKLRSHEILRTQGVPINEHLPVIETEAESLRRTTVEVAERGMTLSVVAFKGETLNNDFATHLLNQFKVMDALSPKERAFIEDVEPSQQDRVQFTWRYECYSVMLWALGFLKELDCPSSICDVRSDTAILSELGRDGFVAAAKLRPQSELLDAADLIYRYHWAVVDVSWFSVKWNFRCLALAG